MFTLVNILINVQYFTSLNLTMYTHFVIDVRMVVTFERNCSLVILKSRNHSVACKGWSKREVL